MTWLCFHSILNDRQPSTFMSVGNFNPVYSKAASLDNVKKMLFSTLQSITDTNFHIFL